MDNKIDILEDTLYNISPDLLNALLKDHTKSTKDTQQNIFFATSDYEHLGKGYGYDSPITPELITGEHGDVIRPRVLKRLDLQTSRTKDKAEVFTPSWVCNAQNNLIDEAWFGRKDVFNRELPYHAWEDCPDKIKFPKSKSWRDYVRDVRLEITCGEAPYLTSRYDTTTAESIPLPHRIGIIDRKLRIVSENTETSKGMARRQPADCPREYAVYVHRLLPRKIRNNASNEVASLHRLYRFMESLANGRT